MTLDSDLYLNNSSLIFDDSGPLTVGCGTAGHERDHLLVRGKSFQPEQPAGDPEFRHHHRRHLFRQTSTGRQRPFIRKQSYYGPFINQGTIEGGTAAN